MVLLLFIVKEEDCSSIANALLDAGYQATMIATTGEFLQYGNTTFLLGTQESEVDKIVSCIEKNTSVRFIEQLEKKTQTSLHRAAIFVLHVDQYVKLTPSTYETAN